MTEALIRAIENLETDIRTLRLAVESLRLKTGNQPPAAPDPETIKLMKEVDDVTKALANGLPPPPPTERCVSGKHRNNGYCSCAASDQAVEDKIKEILNAEHDWLKDRLDYRLRELVLLARGGKA